MLEFSEELFCLSLEKVWDKRIPFYIYKIPEERVDPQKPMRYRVSVDLGKLTAKVPIREK
jgi:hypothetical protein